MSTTKTVRKLRTRAQWAARIRAAHKETVSAFLKLGRMLSAAKKALPHGEFLKMIDHDLPFTASTAQRLMKIAGDPKIANAARAQLLPPAWGALYELTKVPAETFEQAAATGVIRPTMTREDASKLVPIKITHETKRIGTVGYVSGEPKPMFSLPALRSEVLDSTSLSLLEQLGRLEKVVKALSMGGEIPAGSETERRIRVAASTLFSLIGQSRESHIIPN